MRKKPKNNKQFIQIVLHICNVNYCMSLTVYSIVYFNKLNAVL